MRLSGRRVLVTGAASGIGRTTAQRFAQEGARVGLLDRNRAALGEVLEELGPEMAGAVCDVSDEGSVRAAVDMIASRLGGLDGVVNCAGIDLMKPFGEMTAAEWGQVLAINLNGPFHVCSAALPHMRCAGVAGTIVNVASGAGLRPLADRTAYCASKGGLVMFTKALAMDLEGDNIRANVICPGIIDTPLFRASYKSAPDPEAELARIVGRYVIKRVGRPDDIASAALFLTSEESSYMTGTAIAVDGGRTFH
jgi:NAD(P)-dependent dehydrogenase (short-subunit alcohol dehydrogenase family)